MGIFDKSNYIVNTSVFEQVFQYTAKAILLAKMIKLWTLFERHFNNCVHLMWSDNVSSSDLSDL